MTRKKFIKLYTDFLQRVIKLNQKAIQYGISSLENEIYDIDDNDLRMGLRFVVDETEPAVIDEIFSNKIDFEKDKYTRQLMVIKKRAVLGIRKQEKFSVFYCVLNSYANLTLKESCEIDNLILFDDSDDADSDGDNSQNEPSEKVNVKYTFGSKVSWAIAKETIENELGKDPTGVDFGDTDNLTITSKMDCPDPAKLDKIIDNCEGVTHTHYVEWDPLGL